MDSDLILDLIIIFVLRALDVGIAMVRIVLLGRGRRAIAAGLGFVEAIVWVVAVARVLAGSTTLPAWSPSPAASRSAPT
jgi:uncharacterized protein YebE (UPF0316 family)